MEHTIGIDAAFYSGIIMGTNFRNHVLFGKMSEEEILEEEINKSALKIGRKVLDELCLHGENTIEVNIKKRDMFGWYSVHVGSHTVTGLLGSHVEFIEREGLSEEKLKDFEIKKKEENK